MKLAEALSIVAKAPASAKPWNVLLVCGFTPLHLQNYLAAYLQSTHPDRKVKLDVGLFGDLLGTVSQFVASGSGLAVIALEWSDLDPRLGFRQSGGWGQRVVPSILDNVTTRLKQLECRLEELTSASKVILTLPTLGLPPAFHTTGYQSSEAELRLHAAVAAFAANISAHPSISIVNSERLALTSPCSSRYDFRSDLNTGFPYSQAHADALSFAFAELARPSVPKKGLITDLDDTFWRGIVGEIGASEVSWDLADHSQIHGLYQQTVRALAEQGALVAIASKNSPGPVEEALSRADLVMDREKVFPIEVHWEPKSSSVSRILQTWNVGADSVVFIDDSPLELAEVKATHPDVECILFPKNDYPACFALLVRLRDLFGKPRLSEEDNFRLQSIRQGAQFAERSAHSSAEDLLATAEAVLTFDFTGGSSDKRILELVNKTNQFNLNGKRYDDESWSESLSRPAAFLLALSYQDKFGPLGKIAVAKGRLIDTDVLLVDTWVLSCRAFSRQIEHQTLAQLFAHFKVSQIQFAYAKTARNEPTTRFLSLLLEREPRSTNEFGSSEVLSKEQFQKLCPILHHEVKIIS